MIEPHKNLPVVFVMLKILAVEDDGAEVDKR